MSLFKRETEESAIAPYPSIIPQVADVRSQIGQNHR